MSEGLLLAHKNESKPAGRHVCPTDQLEVALEVALLLVRTYGLKEVVGHEDVAPERKTDPGPAFAMESFRSSIFGRGDDLVA